MGENNILKVRKTFANSIILHFALGVFLVVLFEVIGFYLISEKLQISVERLETAKNVFHFVVISTFITIIAVPYDSMINAKENMLFLSITGIFDSVLKLLVAFLLFLPFEDKLLIFGLGMLLRAVLMRIIKQIYCFRKYKDECKVNYRDEFDLSNITELYSFAGWNLLGVLAYMFRNQGVSVILNLFFSTVVNAAYGIANQVNSQLKMFSSAMLQAMNPHMVKIEGSGDRDKLIRLSLITSKFSFYLFSLFALPLYLEMEFIIGLWLVNVPESTILFCKLMILLTIIQQYRTGITMATHAIGNIKEYQLLNSPIQLLSLPIGYLVLKMGYPAYYILVVVIIIEIITLITNIFFFKKSTGYSKWKYSIDVIFKSSICLIFSFILSFFIKKYLMEDFNKLLRLLVLTATSMVTFLVTIYFVSFKENEKLIFLKLSKKIYSIVSAKNK
jgi:Na+-driven multidrug efflux pump